MAERPIQVDGASGVVIFETLRRDDLKDVSREDVFLRLKHHFFVFFSCRIAPDFRLRWVGHEREWGNRARFPQGLDDRIDALPRRCVGGLGVGKIV